MASTYNEAVFDFDLNFLHPTTPDDGQNKFEKQRRAVLIVKKKTIATDALIKKYYARKDVLDQTEKSLLTSKEECKQICIDYRKSMENCSKLENDMQMIRNVNKELEDKCFQAENQYAAATSLTNQLQMLVKEQETQIESITIENKLAKLNIKDHEKKITALQKENDILLKHMCWARNVILKKKKLNNKLKSVLKTYEKHKYASDCDSGDGSDTDDSYAAPPSPMDDVEDTENTVNTLKSLDGKTSIQHDSLVKNDGIDSNDVVSTDTGRGSSLAFSDSDKCFHSPDYYMNDSPQSEGYNTNKSKKLQSTATSPIMFTKLVEISTSPVIFEEQKDNCEKDTIRNSWSIFDSPHKPNHRGTEGESSVSQIETINIGTSPIKHLCNDADLHIQRENKSTSPIIFTEYRNISTSPNKVHIVDVTTSPIKNFTTKTNTELVQADKALSPIIFTTHKNVSTCTREVHTVDVTTSPIKKYANEKSKMLSPALNLSHPLFVDEHDIPTDTNVEIQTNHPSNLSNTTIPEISINLIQTDESSTKVKSSHNDTLNNKLLTTDTSLNRHKKVEKQTNKEKECLKLHNSDNMEVDSISDSEIEMILSTMRMNHKLITPIPKSPKKSQPAAVAVSRISNVPVSNNHQQDHVCHDAALVREDNKKLQATISELVKEVMSIKLMLGQQKLPTILENPSELRVIDSTNIVEKVIIDPSQSKTPKKARKSQKLSKNDNVDKSKNSKQKELVQNTLQEKTPEIIQSADSSKAHQMKSPRNINFNQSSNLESAVNEQTSVGIISNPKPICCLENISNNVNLITKTNSDAKNLSLSITEPAADENILNLKITEPVFTDNTLDLITTEVPLPPPNISNINLIREPSDDDIIDLNITEPVSSDYNKDSITTETTSDDTVMDLNTTATTFIDCNTNLNTTVSPDNSLVTKETAFNQLPELSPVKKGKLVKTRKPTKLDKFKQKMLPKCKIKTDEPLPKKLQLKPCKVLIPRLKKIVTDLDSSVTLNSKDVYEKAVKVMSELKAKQNHTPDPREISDCGNNNNNTTDKHTPMEISTTLQHKPSVGISSFSTTYNSKNHDDNFNNVKEHTPLAIMTRSRSKSFSLKEDELSPRKPTRFERKNSKLQDDQSDADDHQPISELCRKRTRRNSGEKPNMESVPCKRILRSTAANINSLRKQSNVSDSVEQVLRDTTDKIIQKEVNCMSPKQNSNPKSNSQTEPVMNDVDLGGVSHPKESILCTMIQKYGVKSVRYSAKKNPDSVTDSIVKKIEEGLTKISELPTSDTKKVMDKLVVELNKFEIKHLMAAFIKYLKNPDRKTELYKTINSPPAPPMTKSEQVLLYVISQLNTISSVDIVEELMKNIEFTLFALNRTPDFVVIESMSHFYAVLCRYFKFKSRLRVFIMDAMYCMQFKAVPLIKQCLEVWMLILPLAHMGIAKSPLVTCLVYLLHFYKCEDKYNRVQEIRNILYRKYFYQVTEWNETKIMEMLKSSIMEIRPLNIEKKMLRMAIIIFAKRHGTKWCQRNIVNKILIPLIMKKDVPSRVKEFCLSMLGPLVKPYPADMKVDCEVVLHQLVNIFQQNPPDRIKEAIVASLLYMEKHDQFRILRLLVDWRPKTISLELEEALRDFVKSKPLKTWTITLSKLRLHDK